MKFPLKRILFPLTMIVSSAIFCSYIGSMKWLKVNYFDVNFCNIDKKLEGLKILHISDLHSNNSKQIHINIWNKIEKLDFNLVVITGDIITGDISNLSPHFKYIKNLSDRCPVYFVDGNHEYHNYDNTVKVLRDLGVIVLANNKHILTYNGIEFEIIGFRDYYYLTKTRFDQTDNLFISNYNIFKIVLSHQPQIFNNLDSLENILLLCGHTHGGQIRLPFFPVLVAPGQGIFPKYGYGWYSKGNIRMFISKGVGTTRFPIRFYNRPEISIITIKTANI